MAEAQQPAISKAEAARFLLQAQFSASEDDIALVRSQGYGGWLDQAFKKPFGQKGCDWLDERGHNKITPKGEYFYPQMGDFMIWNQLLSGEDQMRRRFAFALSQFFVVSLDAIDGFWPPYMIGAYWDLLNEHAFGNFRDLLEKVTLNSAMGLYLNTKGNQKEDDATGRQPDENYAREIMQLFTIGLYELNPDGTHKLDKNGAPIETYTQDDITNLARVFTGYDYDFLWTKFTKVDWLNYPVPDQYFCKAPMRLDPLKHSMLPVEFLGTKIPAGTPGPEKLKIAHDRLFAHPNVGPFFCRQMIQRLVNGNPDPAYVARVSAVFDDNGNGVRGDLKAVWKAVLTDPAARTLPEKDDPDAGKLREPVVRFVQWAQTVGVKSENGEYQVYNLGRNDRGIGQSPLRSPSVFNFFRPGYVPPQTAMAEGDVTAPEFQIHNETSTAGYINTLQWIIRWGYNDVKPTYEPLLPIAHDVDAVIKWLDLHFSANQLSSKTRLIIRNAVAGFSIRETSPDDYKISMLAAACLLVLASPDYLIQK